MKRHRITISASLFLALVLFSYVLQGLNTPDVAQTQPLSGFDSVILNNARQRIVEGRQIFHFDTFGDEAFWGDSLKLHLAIAGAKFGSLGPGLSPNAALALGLKVDVEALPQNIVVDLKGGKSDLMIRLLRLRFSSSMLLWA